MVGIIIQARMGSCRLPGKVLMDFEGKSLLEHIVDRIKRLLYPAETVIATSNLAQDDAIEEFCEKRQIKCFRGSEENVLERYYKCAERYGFTHIVRMTGDNPFPDMEELDRLIVYHQEKGNDFSENFSELPIGVGMEIMSFKALEESVKYADLPKHFEHADEYILDHLNDYRHGTLKVEKGKNRPEVRLTVDTLKDYERACFILKNVGEEYVTTQLAIELGEKYDCATKQEDCK